MRAQIFPRSTPFWGNYSHDPVFALSISCHLVRQSSRSLASPLRLWASHWNFWIFPNRKTDSIKPSSGSVRMEEVIQLNEMLTRETDATSPPNKTIVKREMLMVSSNMKISFGHCPFIWSELLPRHPTSSSSDRILTRDVWSVAALAPDP